MNEKHVFVEQFNSTESGFTAAGLENRWGDFHITGDFCYKIIKVVNHFMQIDAILNESDIEDLVYDENCNITVTKAN